MSTFWTKFAQKECFWLKKKSEHCHWIQRNQISLGIKFHLKLKILKIWTKFVQEGCFQSKTKKVNSIIEFNILELVQVSSFTASWQFWYFRQNCPKQVIFGRKQKSEQHHLILNIWIRLSIKFHLELTILIFWTKFAQKTYSWSKTEKVNIAIEFCIFELL